MLYCANLNLLASRREDLSRDFFPQHFGSSLLSPQPPPSTQIRGYYLKAYYLKA